MARRDREHRIIFLRQVGSGQQWLAGQDRLRLEPRIPKRRRRKPAAMAELKGIFAKPEP